MRPAVTTSCSRTCQRQEMGLVSRARGPIRPCTQDCPGSDTGSAHSRGLRWRFSSLPGCRWRRCPASWPTPRPRRRTPQSIAVIARMRATRRVPDQISASFRMTPAWMRGTRAACSSLRRPRTRSFRWMPHPASPSRCAVQIRSDTGLRLSRSDTVASSSRPASCPARGPRVFLNVLEAGHANALPGGIPPD